MEILRGCGEMMERARVEPQTGKKCIVCSRERMEGISITQQFICRDCEGEMVSTDVHEEKYPFFIRQMKKIWVKENV